MRHHPLVTILTCLGFALETYGTLTSTFVVISIGDFLISLAKALE